MTEQIPDTNVHPTVRLWAGTDRVAGIAALLPPFSGDITLVPSSLDRRDLVLADLRRALRSREARSRVVVPANPLGALASLGKRDAWVEVPQAQGEHSVRLPSALATADTLWSVTDVRAVSGRGPYVLDLMARFVTPAERLRLLGSSSKSDAVEVNLALRPDFCLLAWQAHDECLLLATSDVIAAELIALALVDEDLGDTHRLAGPWEDDLVQRATELDLGVRLPQEFSLSVASGISDAMSDIVSRVFARIGVSTW